MEQLILTYHYFHTDRPRGIPAHDYHYSVSADRLRSDCETIIASGCDLIDPGNVIESLDDKSDRRGLIISIDDGHDSVKSIASDLFAEFKIMPVLNIIANRVGRENYMSWAAIRELSQVGFSIESHSLDHKDLTGLSNFDLANDLESSRKIIEDKTGKMVSLLTAPMGRVNKQVIRAAQNAGYKGVMTSFNGINRSQKDIWSLKRFQVKSGQQIDGLDNYFNAFSQKRLVGNFRNLARRALIKLGK